MATGIESLFNLKTPEEYQRDYLTGMMVNPAQMGNQSLYQQIISTMANAGAMGGAGIGRLMGGRTSGEVQRAAVDDVFKTVSQQGLKTESEKYRAAAQLFQEKGMYQEAEQVMAKYREAVKEEQAQEDRAIKQRQGTTRKRTELQYKPILDDLGEVVGYEPKQIEIVQEWNPALNDGKGGWVDISPTGDEMAGVPKPGTAKPGTAKPGTPQPGTPKPTGQSTTDAIAAELARRAKEGANVPKTATSKEQQFKDTVKSGAAQFNAAVGGDGATYKESLGAPKEGKAGLFPSSKEELPPLVFRTERERQIAIERARSTGNMREAQRAAKGIIDPRYGR